jgi:NitT/TauT family transport system ATP-binding protein
MSGAPPTQSLNPLTYIFQDFALLPWRTVEGNVSLVLEDHPLASAQRAAIIADVLERTKLAEFKTALPRQLSGGMKQRVAIARTFAVGPKVLLMDEPFGALDAQTRTIMQEELVRLSRVNPKTILFITHSVEEAVYLADRVIVMGRNPGRIREVIEVGPTREAEGWADEPIDDVMEMPSFTHLRGQVWRLLREEMGGDL